MGLKMEKNIFYIYFISAMMYVIIGGVSLVGGGLVINDPVCTWRVGLCVGEEVPVLLVSGGVPSDAHAGLIGHSAYNQTVCCDVGNLDVENSVDNGTCNSSLNGFSLSDVDNAHVSLVDGYDNHLCLKDTQDNSYLECNKTQQNNTFCVFSVPENITNNTHIWACDQGAGYDNFYCWSTGPLMEICNNSLDDDGDEEIDCEDSDCYGQPGPASGGQTVYCCEAPGEESRDCPESPPMYECDTDPRFALYPGYHCCPGGWMWDDNRRRCVERNPRGFCSPEYGLCWDPSDPNCARNTPLPYEQTCCSYEWGPETIYQWEGDPDTGLPRCTGNEPSCIY